MSLHDDLLEQAQHLARRDPRRPRQASLRRAISTAYYALFHLLTREASAALVAGQGPRGLVCRAFDHAEMKQACRPFAAANLPAHVAAAAGAEVPADLRQVAGAFLNLQEMRHEADYNVSGRFSRALAVGSVARAE